MKTIPKPLFFLALAGLGVAAWYCYRGQAKQATTLARIAALNARLTTNNTQQTKRNAATMRGIGRSVDKNRNQVRDVMVLTQSQEIIDRCDSLTRWLQQAQQMLRVEANEPRSGALHHPGAATILTPSRAARLAQALNGYSDFIRTYVPGTPALAPKAAARSGTTWLYPDGAPLAAALVSLTRLQAETRRLATEALQRQAEKVGSGCCMCFNKIGAVAVAASNTVAPGALYEAKLFMAQSATGLRPTMSVDGRPVAVGPDGQGVIEFRVPPLRPG